MRNLDDVTLLDLLPSTMRNDPDAIAAAQAISPEYWRLRKLAPKVVVTANIDGLAEKWLDLLANDMHVDFYDHLLPIEKKRELVSQSIQMHRRKGTPWAVDELIRIVFGGGNVEEWFEYGGQPYHFKIYVPNPLTTADDAKRFLAALDSVKNLRSALDEIWTLRNWGLILERDGITWGGVLVLNTWGNVRGLIWHDPAEVQKGG